MTPEELEASISRQINQATGAVGDEISSSRANSFKRYMGELYGDETENRSSVVSSDVSDTIEWIMPELMEIFTGGDKVVSFEPEGPEDEELAEQETDTVNFVFSRKNDGFMVLYNFIKDGLIQKNGYVKRYWSVKDKITTEEYEGVSVVQWAQMQADWESKGVEVEILREDIEGLEDAEEADADDMQPAPADPMAEIVSAFMEPSLSVEVRLTRTEEREIIESVPPEEMLVSPRWNKVSLDDCPFIAHRRSMMVTELVEMGYDEEQVKSLPRYFDDEMSEEKIDRFSSRGSSEFDQREENDEATRQVLVHECYMLVDYDDDGRAERRKIMVGGAEGQILRWADGGKDDNDEVEVQPFSSWTPVPIPHRHYGRGVAELVEDLQRIKTVLFRQMLDNIYLTNNVTREIAEGGMGESTLSDLLHDRPGKILRTAQPGHYFEHAPPSIMAAILPAIEYVDTVRENRTGVTRYNQGLDSNSLNKTASGMQKIMNASMKKLALYARIFAETGLKHLMMGIHGDMRRNASKAITVKLRNNYVEVDPRSWQDRSDMTVNVGAGTIDKEMRLGLLQKIIDEQKTHLMQGSPLVTMGNLYNSYERFVTTAGLKNPEEFFVNPAKPTNEPPKQDAPPPPDPQAEAFIKVEGMKAQQRQQEAEQKMQLDMVKLRMEDDRERDKTNMDYALRVAEMNAKGITAITLASLQESAKQAAMLNQPPTNGSGV